MYSGKFLNDIGEYENCAVNESSRFMLAKIDNKNIHNHQNVGDSQGHFITGICVPFN